MNRRTFNQIIGATSATMLLHPLASFAQPANPMTRIGMSTVNFRERFSKTRSKDSSYSGGNMELIEIPEYFADRFSLHNVELWSKHFESLESSYLKELKKALRKTKSTLINIQCDEKYSLGAAEESQRRESIELAIKWVRAAKKLGAGAIRFNPGKGEIRYVIEGLRAINAVAKKKGIALLIENHFGMEMDPEVHLRIVKGVGENTYTLPDFGNYSNEARFESLKKILPHAYQVSVKTIEFDQDMNHLSFDFDQCMKLTLESGFEGIYSVEQWHSKPSKVSDEAMADWMIKKVLNYLV